MSLAALGIGLMAGGQVYGGISAYGESKDEAKIAKDKAAVKEQEVKTIEAKTGFDVMRAAEEGERTQQTLQTNIGASGAVPTMDSPLLAQAVQASENNLKNLMIGYEGRISAQRARTEAEGFRLQGKMAKARGRSALTGSLISAGGTLLGGFFGEPEGGGGTLTPKTGGKLGKQLKKAGYFEKSGGFKSKLATATKTSGKFGAPPKGK